MEETLYQELKKIMDKPKPQHEMSAAEHVRKQTIIAFELLAKRIELLESKSQGEVAQKNPLKMSGAEMARELDNSPF